MRVPACLARFRSARPTSVTAAVVHQEASSTFTNTTQDPNDSMMKSPPPATLPVKQKTVRKIAPHLLNRARRQDKRGSLWQKPQGQCGASRMKMGSPSSWVVQHQEMDFFFRLFEDDVIQDFLKMDSCYKMTDKYLLAMTFVYFKRACFTHAEYTRRNFFIALYLANTMEEEEEKNKYEIFPWALGKNWRKCFCSFLLQRDELWARMQYRAAVSRRCCDQVMAIKSSHSVWRRQRRKHHSGAQRQYGNQDYGVLPRGPSTSPLSCAECTGSRKLPVHPTSSAYKRKVWVSDSPCLSPLSFMLSLEVTPPKPTKSQARQFKAQYAEEAPRSISECTHDLFMDWISEE